MWPREKRPFKWEELATGPRGAVSSPREETALVRATLSAVGCDAHSREAWARGPETQV